eukprot:CAMPEP_0117749878 /NCGR_PEP_ID=MMETSP0947-20121206/9998_1 /TAXON_ID=44440 /ORGANISM="Chattonella subsalsa, Strain CCMP2191" /LENGTH=352 /DNA_ID=CAMNT_0005567865 /DNA_START=1648 /DNA_END=2706 /DNA_ORIENTATION=+
MGLCLSAEEKKAKQKSKEVDAVNKKEFEMESSKLKLLLLGAGESGKSTIFKQMKILYGVPPNNEERRQQTPVIYNNTIVAMKTLVKQTIKFDLEDEVKCPDALKEISLVDDNVNIDEKIGSAIKNLWNDRTVQEVWERRSEFQIVDSTQYFFENIDRIMQPGYLASQDDLLYTRVRTTGIVTDRYKIDGAVFEMYDVGGQRNERKKWIHCFDNVTSVIFVAALSEYDQNLFEDASKNRMVEAIELFAEICNNRYFEHSSLILFLNKKDLFADKIKRKDIKSVIHFNDFSGGLCDYNLGIQYFLDLFLKQNQNPQRKIYHHVTCATDTSNVKVVFDACKDIILRGNLKDSGLV